jgi:hypothetical protein
MLSGNPDSVAVTVSGSRPDVQSVHGLQQGEQLDPSMNPTGYMPAAKISSPHNGADVGSETTTASSSIIQHSAAIRYHAVPSRAIAQFSVVVAVFGTVAKRLVAVTVFGVLV